jgi:hypothetical protein
MGPLVAVATEDSRREAAATHPEVHPEVHPVAGILPAVVRRPAAMDRRAIRRPVGAHRRAMVRLSRGTEGIQARRPACQARRQKRARP